MTDPSSMPKLPGFQFDSQQRQHYGRKQTFAAKNGYTIPKGVDSDDAAHDIDIDQLTEATKTLTYTTTTAQTTATGALPITNPPHVPAHVALDKKVLTFDGYFKETVHESAEEHFRVRKVKVFYYLEDDTMSVLEPMVENSGLPQGKLIRRQRLPKDAEGATYMWSDLNIATNLSIYGRVFRLVGCDKYTQAFLESNGIEVNEPEAVPEDPYSTKRKIVEQPSTLSTTPSDFDKLKQFITLDRKVLRFYAVWDDSKSLFGEKRPYIIHYFLVDDTLEVREQHHPNDGRDKYPMLLRRQRVLRDHKALPNEFPSIVLEPTADENDDYLGPADLMLGQTIHILGRDFLIFDCDDFTKEFYRRNFGVEDFTPVDVSEPVRSATKLDPPAHDGFGSYEDSMQSVLSLKPKPPKANVAKLLEFDNKALRFRARIDTDNPIEAERTFVLSYILASDTISIFEPKSRNTHGGKFLEAQRIAKPGYKDPVYYGPGDLYIGARIEVYGRTFVIEDCDLFVATYAEGHASEYTPEALAAIKQNAGM